MQWSIVFAFEQGGMEEWKERMSVLVVVVILSYIMLSPIDCRSPNSIFGSHH